MKIKIFNYKYCRISSLWLIIFTTVAIVSSCSPSAVRTSSSSKPKQVKETPAKKEAIKDEKVATIEDKIKEFEEKTAVAKKAETPEKVDQERRLPTLREQMNALSEEQVVINAKVSGLQGDINDIRNTLEEIKVALHKNNALPKKQVVAGISDEVPEERLSKNDRSDVLLSDEEDDTPYVQRQSKKPSSSPAATIKPKAKPATTKAPKEEAKSKQPEERSEKAEPEQKSDLAVAINLFSQKQHSKSIDELNEIVGSSKNVAIKTEAHYWLAENLMALSSYDQAISHYNQVASSKLSDRKDDATAKIAECLLKLGQTSEARNTYKQLIEKYPKSEYVPKARKLLQQI